MKTNNISRNKFALIMVTDTAYLRGANATINAMDYYGNTMDLIIIYEMLPDSYIEEVLKQDFNFRIEFIHYDELKEEFYKDCPGISRNRFNLCCYVRHWYINKIKDLYSITGIIESDAMLLDNIVPWYEFAEGTDKLLTAYHSYQSAEIENYNKDILDFVQPLYIHPLICDPRKWTDFFQMIIKIASERPQIIDMMAMNQSVFLCNKVDKVVILNDPEWLGGWIYTNPIFPYTLLNGKKYLITHPSHMRIKMLHGKYYSTGFRESIVRQSLPEHRPVFSQNLKYIHDFFKYFNDELKVKLPNEFRYDMDRRIE